MAYANDTTRRSLLAIATLATLLPSAVSSAPDPWAELIAAHGQCHPNALAAIAKARGAGLDPATLSCVSLTGAAPQHLPALWFGDVASGHYSVVTPAGGQFHTRFH